MALFHIAFYRFVRVADTARAAAALRMLTSDLRGSVLVATEGINGTLSGDAAALDRFEADVGRDPILSELIGGIVFRRTPCSTPPFQRMKVHERAEILPLGVGNVDAVGQSGVQLDPLAWRALLDSPDLVLIDNRNRFEYRLGRFRGALDPQVDNLRDLPSYIEAHAAAWKVQNKRIAMYCTGGIRCEKTAAWMERDFGLTVHQLQGGILRYLAEAPDASRDWQGECFVFDNRIALDAQLRETATRAEDVYDDSADERWRLQRARRLDDGVSGAPE